MAWLKDSNTKLNETDAYEQGELARENGDDPETNPYYPYGANFDEWEDGYYADSLRNNGIVSDE